MNQISLKRALECYDAQALSASSVFYKPLVMGIVNLTPDSFSNDGIYKSPAAACRYALACVEQGADMLDIGGESTRPGAPLVSCDEEIDRVVPVIQAIRAHSDIAISVDTQKPLVMRAALEAGANMINDVSALSYEGAVDVVREYQVPVCVMHMQGTPQTMQIAPQYTDHITDDMLAFFKHRVNVLMRAGIEHTHIILDPGFGFGKTVAHNLDLMRYLGQLHVLGFPLMIGYSRKSTLGAVLGVPVDERDSAGIALAVWSALQGVFMIRTHDVHGTWQALTMLEAIQKR